MGPEQDQIAYMGPEQDHVAYMGPEQDQEYAGVLSLHCISQASDELVKQTLNTAQINKNDFQHIFYPYNVSCGTV